MTVLSEAFVSVTLAQSAAAGPTLLWIGILIAVAVAGGAFVMVIRNRMLAKPPSDSEAKGSMLQEIREMRRRGEMTEEQFQAARDSILGKSKRVRRVVKGEIHEDGTIKARPGFDLTGSPLPGMSGNPPDGSTGA